MTDADILDAAMDNARAYHKELQKDNPDVESVAEWKEIAFFKQGAKWARKKIIDAACEWLSQNLQYQDPAHYNYDMDKMYAEFVEDFKQAMEE